MNTTIMHCHPMCTHAHAEAIARRIYPAQAVIRPYRSRRDGELLLIIESDLSMEDLARRTGTPLDRMGTISGHTDRPADEYLAAHPELVSEHPGSIPSLTVVR